MYMSSENVMKNKIIYQILAKNLRITEDSINLETDTTKMGDLSTMVNPGSIDKIRKVLKN